MTFRFPDDLMALQTSWLETYDALAASPLSVGTTTLRRRLITLSRLIHSHPYWTAPGHSRAAGAELRRRARARAWVRAA
ncbi:hypothetical protein AB0P15_33335 [Streptomyces sp. NPDC087917]|uniref:hypothetical protein n=1 Tax=unclassified Streptomyces TaxID=2593676 RepID=UPI0034353150